MFVLCTLFGLLCTPPAFALDWNVTKDIQYGTTAAESADIYFLNKGNNPLIIFIHGGGWGAGDKSSYASLAAQYAAAGFSSMAINYRLSNSDDPKFLWNVQLQDVQTAVRWIRSAAAANPGLHIDPNRIGAVGDSAGGHLALFLGSLDYTYMNLNADSEDRSQLYSGISPKVQAVGDLFGPSDLTAPEMQTLISTQTFVFGHKTFASDPAFIRNASPVFYMNKNTAPTCILHGTQDTLVPISQSYAVANKLQNLGVSYQWFTYNGGHGFEGLSSAKTTSLNENIIKCMAAVLHPKPSGWLPWL